MARGCVKIIIVFSFLVLTLSVVFFLYVWPEHKERGTALLIHNLGLAAGSYRLDFGELPPIDTTAFAAALLGKNERDKIYLNEKQRVARDGRFVDYWRRDLRIEKDGEGKGIRVLSAGPDGEFGTADDLGPDSVWQFYPDEKPEGGPGE